MTERNVNVAVFGSGIAGLTCALTLLQKGVKDVAVFEKRPFQGGAVSNTPMCFMSVKNDRAYQDRAFRAHNEASSFSCNMAAARAFINNSWRIPAFVSDLGVKYEMVVETPLEEIGRNDAYTGGFPFWMNLGDYYILKGRGKGHGAALVCLRAAQRIRKLGGDLVFNAALSSLIREDGRVTGAMVRMKDGTQLRVNANAVVIATGGIGNAGADLMLQETGYIYTDREGSDDGNAFCNSFFNDQATGDGLRAIWEAGGAHGPVMGAGRNLGYGGVLGFVPWLPRNQLITIMEQPYLVVNRHGKRFIDEGENRRSANIAAAMRSQPGRVAYLIFDDDTMTHLEKEGTEYHYMIFPATVIENGREQFRSTIEDAGSRHVFTADSLEELADKTGICRENLLETVRRYNRMCDQGYDEDFAKNPAYLRPVRKPKYYCIKMMNVTYSMIGGVCVNEKCQVLDNSSLPIPGLYAAGDLAASSVYGPAAPNVTSVSALAYVQGMICADSLAEQYGKTC